MKIVALLFILRPAIITKSISSLVLLLMMAIMMVKIMIIIMVVMMMMIMITIKIMNVEYIWQWGCWYGEKLDVV